MEIELKIPTDYSTITLKQYLDMQQELKSYEDDEEAQSAILLQHLCGLDPIYLKHLKVEDYNTIKSELVGFLNVTELPLQRIIKIDGKEYGFEPNLSNMTYGAYVDITQHESITIDENWAKIMAILYRPVTKKIGDRYVIQAYDNSASPTLFMNVGMDIHFGALFFFLHLSMDLLKGILSSTKEELPPNMRQILERSGKVMEQSWNSQEGTLPGLMKLVGNR